MEESCEDCKYFEQYEHNKSGLCLRYPPMVTTVRSDTNEDYVVCSVKSGNSCFPDVNTAMWCGEFKAKGS